MKIDKELLDKLSAQAKASPRLRQAYDMRTTSEDNSQRILNRWSSERRVKLALPLQTNNIYRIKIEQKLIRTFVVGRTD